MVKGLIAVIIFSAVGVLGYVGQTTLNKKNTQKTIEVSCATSLTALNGQLSRQKLVSYGEFHDFVYKRVSWLNDQLKTKKLSNEEFQSQAVTLFTTYGATSMKTCQTILEPTFKKCQDKKDSNTCALEASRAFAYGLKLVYEDNVRLKQPLDLSRIVAFDIRTAISQSRPPMQADEKSEFQRSAAFLAAF